MVMVNTYNTLCAQSEDSSLQALAEKHVEASPSGHSCLVAMCSLALSHVGR